jgi:hypothetical protein
MPKARPPRGMSLSETRPTVYNNRQPPQGISQPIFPEFTLKSLIECIWLGIPEEMPGRGSFHPAGGFAV